MDYLIQKDGITIQIEEQRQWVGTDIIAQYVALRKKLGYTQEDVSKATGIARPNIAGIESGKYTPTLEVLTKLAGALNMDLEVRFIEREKVVS